MSAVVLTEEEVARLRVAVDLDETGLGYNTTGHLMRAVELIVAARVTAAEREALVKARSLLEEKAAEWAKEYAAAHLDADYGRWDAWQNAARIVRSLTPRRLVGNVASAEADR